MSHAHLQGQPGGLASSGGASNLGGGGGTPQHMNGFPDPFDPAIFGELSKQVRHTLMVVKAACMCPASK